MINEPGITLTESVNIQGRKMLLERRTGLISDNLIDMAARQYAVNLRLGNKSSPRPPVGSYSLSRDLVRIR